MLTPHDSPKRWERIQQVNMQWLCIGFEEVVKINLVVIQIGLSWYLVAQLPM
jgi:hypothetical protein